MNAVSDLDTRVYLRSYMCIAADWRCWICGCKSHSHVDCEEMDYLEEDLDLGPLVYFKMVAKEEEDEVVMGKKRKAGEDGWEEPPAKYRRVDSDET